MVAFCIDIFYLVPAVESGGGSGYIVSDRFVEIFLPYLCSFFLVADIGTSDNSLLR